MKLKYQPGEHVPEWLRTRAKEMISRPIDLKNRYIHVTQLLSPAPQLVMTDAHWKELEQSPDDLIPAMMGSAWHSYVEGAMTGGYTEQRMEILFESQAPDWLLIGTPDWYDHNKLVDHKTTKVWSAVFSDGGVKREWEEQCNVYRFIIAQATGVVIPRLEIHCIYTDWTRNGMLRNDKHPRKRWEVLDVPVWELEDTRRFIEARLLAIEATAPFDYCTPDERWERGEHWALCKHGRKSAIKKYDTEDEALAACYDADGNPINAYYVEHRPGVPVRCNDWCSVRQFCSYGKKLDEEAAQAVVGAYGA